MTLQNFPENIRPEMVFPRYLIRGYSIQNLNRDEEDEEECIKIPELCVIDNNDRNEECLNRIDDGDYINYCGKIKYSNFHIIKMCDSGNSDNAYEFYIVEIKKYLK